MAYRDVMRSLGRRRWFAWAAARLAPLDTRVFKATRGRFGLLGSYGLPQLLLTTTGRKSGQPRTVTLLYGGEGDQLVVVASNFGQEHHPGWAFNLVADPAATVEVKGRSWPVTASLIEDDAERDAVWAIMRAIYPAYDDYRDRAPREIMLFALQRR